MGRSYLSMVLNLHRLSKARLPPTIMCLILSYLLTVNRGLLILTPQILFPVHCRRILFLDVFFPGEVKRTWAKGVRRKALEVCRATGSIDMGVSSSSWGYPNSWMVYFMGQFPTYQWMMTGGTPMAMESPHFPRASSRAFRMAPSPATSAAARSASAPRARPSRRPRRHWPWGMVRGGAMVTPRAGWFFLGKIHGKSYR